jgi:hypothetical protein|tara:strand:+ start:368 stop:673 length:306 start_codon:yes stop_codon:yes gene_type:complete
MQIKTFNSNRTLIKQLTKEEFYNLVSDKFTTIGYESSVGKRSEINGRIGVNKGIKGTGRKVSKDIEEHSIMFWNRKYNSFNRLYLDNIRYFKSKGTLYLTI